MVASAPGKTGKSLRSSQAIEKSMSALGAKSNDRSNDHGESWTEPKPSSMESMTTGRESWNSKRRSGRNLVLVNRLCRCDAVNRKGLRKARNEAFPLPKSFPKASNRPGQKPIGILYDEIDRWWQNLGKTCEDGRFRKPRWHPAQGWTADDGGEKLDRRRSLPAQ